MIAFKGIDPSFDSKPFITFKSFKGMDYCQPYDLEKENIGQGHSYIGFVPDRFVFNTFPKGWMNSINYTGIIRAAGDDTYRMDDRLSAFKSTVRLIAAFEHAHNPDAEKYEAFLIARQTRNILPFQNAGGWHIDFTRQRYGVADDDMYSLKRYPYVDHLYMVADSQPTIVTKGNNREPIFEGALKDKFNTKALDRDSVPLIPNLIAYMNSYSWHKAPRLDAWKQRTFMLMAFRKPVLG